MSRAKAEDIKPVRRTPRKRVVRRTVSADTTSSGVTKREPVVEAQRKAPSRISVNKKPKKSYKKVMIVVGILLIGFAASAYIGNSDSGQINIASVIDERNKQIASGNAASENSPSGSTATIPVQSTAPPTVPNGGLRGRGVGTAKVKQPAPAVAASSTATSSDEIGETASSTATTTATTNNKATSTDTSTEDEMTETEEVAEEENTGETINEDTTTEEVAEPQV